MRHYNLLTFLTVQIFSSNIVYSKIIIEEENKALTSYLYNLSDKVSKTHPAGYIGFVFNNGSSNIAEKVLRYLYRNYDTKVAIVNFDDIEFRRDFIENVQSKIWMGYVKVIFVFTNTYENVPNIIKTLNKLPFHSSRFKMMLILTEAPKNDQLQTMFTFCWSQKYLNIAAIFEKEGKLEMYTFNPFWKKEHFLENISNNEKYVFYNKLKNLNGYTLKIMILKDDDATKTKVKKFPNGTKEWTGYEIDIFNTMAAKMNGTIFFATSHDLLQPNERNPWRNTNVITKNESAIKIRIITEREIDMLNSEEMVLNDDLKGVTESLYPHSKDDMRIFMYVLGEMPHYYYLFMVFNWKVWMVFSALLIAGTLAWMATGRSISWSYKFINVLRMITGGSMPLTATNHSERTFIIFWLFYTLIIITAFTSKLTSVLVDIKYYKDYETLDELNEAGIIIYAWETQIVELRKAFNGTSRYELFSRMKQLPPRFDHVNNQLNNWTDLLVNFVKHNPIILNTERAVWIAAKTGLKGNYNVLKESPIPNFMAFQVPAGSPLKDDINAMLRKIIEAGLIQIWRRLQRHGEILSKMLESDDKVKSEPVALTLDHFQAAYIILFTGLSLSFLVFLAEHVCFKRSCNILETM